jgi:uncharacterized iron-regulated membrane protein
MFKLCVIILALLIPCVAFSERIDGQTTRTYDGGSYTNLRSSDGSSATITTTPQGGISIYTMPSTGEVIGDLERANEGARRAVEQLNRQMYGDHD